MMEITNLATTAARHPFFDFNDAADLILPRHDKDEIRSRLFDQLESVLLYLFPRGKRRGSQFYIGNLQGEPGDSLVVELEGPKRGVWIDFATGESGDVLALSQEQQALRTVESRVFDLMRQEKWPDAYQVLLASDYGMALKLYEINSEAAVGALSIELTNTAREHDQLRKLTLSLRLVAILLLLWAGWRYSVRLQTELAELKAKNADLADQFLRAKADTENMRRRSEEEVAKARKFGIESFAESLLPVCDSLDAALALQNATAEQLHEGSAATLRQLLQALERNKVVVINPAVGDKFDPHQHQAISVVPAEQEANTVVAVLQKGYLIADRVLRPALVTVAAPK